MRISYNIGSWRCVRCGFESTLAICGCCITGYLYAPRKFSWKIFYKGSL